MILKLKHGKQPMEPEANKIIQQYIRHSDKRMMKGLLPEPFYHFAYKKNRDFTRSQGAPFFGKVLKHFVEGLNFWAGSEITINGEKQFLEGIAYLRFPPEDKFKWKVWRTAKQKN